MSNHNETIHGPCSSWSCVLTANETLKKENIGGYFSPTSRLQSLGKKGGTKTILPQFQETILPSLFALKTEVPSSFRNSNWCLFHPKFLPALTTTLRQDLRSPGHSRELLQIHIKLLLELRFWANPSIPVVSEQYWFRTEFSAAVNCFPKHEVQVGYTSTKVCSKASTRPGDPLRVRERI
jgi:hypothetical protein